MADYSIKGGKKVVHSRYSKTGVLGIGAIFPNDKDLAKSLLQKKANLPKGTFLKKIYGVENNSALIRRIYTTFLFKVLNRVANGELFVYPGKAMSNICLKTIPTNKIKELKSKGKYKNINLLLSDGKIPQFVFDFGPKHFRLDIPIYVPKELSEKAIKNAEEGKIPYQIIEKDRVW